MNSFNTQEASAAALAAYPTLTQAVPHDFVQHQIPKIWQADLRPVYWPQEPQLEWCPPGHGDLYLALQTSGMLQQLLDAGYTYAFISNADNLGATVDLDILGYFVANEVPFLMEVAQRTAADRKGGHLAKNAAQGFVLREVAQCPPAELDDFQDINRYAYFNTNNLWVHLPTLQALLQERQGVLALPLIRNEKPVDPTQPESPRVYQLETAMGHAIALFPKAQAIQIARSRFLPVKSTNDLLALWSDAYLLGQDYQVQLNPARASEQPPTVTLDKRFYALFADLQARFPQGAPSLLNCDSFTVEGDVSFTADARFSGNVHIRHTHRRPLQWPGEERP
jgi:UTP--glucose-1-phosphate uridylyltransferase